MANRQKQLESLVHSSEWRANTASTKNIPLALAVGPLSHYLSPLPYLYDICCFHMYKQAYRNCYLGVFSFMVFSGHWKTTWMISHQIMALGTFWISHLLLMPNLKVGRNPQNQIIRYCEYRVTVALCYTAINLLGLEGLLQYTCNSWCPQPNLLFLSLIFWRWLFIPQVRSRH